MNTRRIVILAVLATFAAACNALMFPPKPTAAPNASNDATLLHFDNDWVAFDYPKRLKVHDSGDPAFVWYPNIDLGGELVVGLGDPKHYAHDLYFRSIRIVRRPVSPTSYDFDKLMIESYGRISQKYPIHKSVNDASGPLFVSGLPAYQKTYRVYSGESAYDLRDIWVLNKTELYIISIWSVYSNPDDFADFQSLADGFMRSLEIKDSSPSD